MDLRIRNEAPADADAIVAVTVAAFEQAAHSGHTEQFIVRALRRTGRLTISLVAEHDGRVIAHVAISPVVVSDGGEDWYGLGPVSVLPAHQNRGVGTRLIRQALDTLRDTGAAGCVVLGEPAYYRRFGFVAVPDLVLPDMPAGCFQAIAFRDRMPAGTVAYDAAFDATA